MTNSHWGASVHGAMMSPFNVVGKFHCGGVALLPLLRGSETKMCLGGWLPSPARRWPVARAPEVAHPLAIHVKGREGAVC